MNFEQQRMFAGTLAEKANAPMTLAALRDPETCFEGILTTALTEVGADRLVAYLQRGRDVVLSGAALPAGARGLPSGPPEEGGRKPECGGPCASIHR